MIVYTFSALSVIKEGIKRNINHAMLVKKRSFSSLLNHDIPKSLATFSQAPDGI